MDECLFCRIIAGEIPAEKIYEDEGVVAFLDIHPVNPGHTLVVPKNHVEEWQDMGEDLLEHIMQVAHKLGRKMKVKLNPPRVGLWIEGFEVPHTHVHVCPLEKISDFRTKRTLEDMQTPASADALAKVAAQLRA